MVHIEELVQAFEATGHEVVVIGPAGMDGMKFGGQLGIVDHLKRLLPRHVYELLELVYNLPAYLRLRRAYLRHRPDFIYERYNLFVHAGLWLRSRFRLPLILEVNAPVFEERALHDALALKRLAAWQQRKLWTGADLVLPVSHVLAGQVHASGVQEERVVVVPNGVDLARAERAPCAAEAKQRIGLDGRFVLGFSGFVRTWHALDQVLAFMDTRRDLGDLHLLLVGDGPARDHLERAARDLGLHGRLTITGFVERDRIPELLAAFDVALQPGVTPYASPLKLIEYMAAARPIIAPNTANIRELVTHDVSAMLFDPEDSQAFSSALERLCVDESLRARVAAGARAEIDKKGLTWVNNARRITALAEGLIAKGQANIGIDRVPERGTRGGA